MNKTITKRSNGSIRVISHVGEKSMTDESWKDETDVNNIMAKFKKTGNITHVARLQGTYGDFSNVPDLQAAMQTITEASLAFDALPAKIRERFGNSPQQFLKFMHNTENDPEAIKLGLKTPPRKIVPEPKVTDENKGEARVSKKPSTEHTPVEKKSKKTED